MARKSKGFRELLKQKQAEQNQEKVRKTLEKRISKGALGKELASMKKMPTSEIKMSEVLETFVEPYLASSRSVLNVRTLFSMGVFAWNISLRPESDRQETLDKLSKKIFKGDDLLMEEETTEIINQMIERKQKYFADNKRFIMDFELQGSGDEFHLSVASAESSEEDE